MATNAEAIKVTAPAARSRRNHGKVFFQALRRWAQNGQLGSTGQTELSRYTGSRV